MKDENEPIVNEEENELHDFFTVHDASQETFIIGLYDIVKEGNKKKFVWVYDYENFIPDNKSIGEDFGGGSFKMYSNKKNPGTGAPYTKEVHISSMYGKGKKRLAAEAAQEPVVLAAPAPVPVVAPQMDILTILEKATPLLKLILGERQQPQTQAVDQFSKVMETVATSMVKGTIDMRNEILKMDIEEMRDKRKQANKAPAEEPAWKEFVPLIKDAILQYGERYIAATGIKKTAMDTLIKTDEGFQAMDEAVEKDPDILDQIYDALCNDPDIGETKASKVFTKMGYDVAPSEQEHINEQTTVN